MVKAAFFDIDGTLVSHREGGVPESTRLALEEIREKDRMYINYVNSHVRRVQKAISSPVPVVGTYYGNSVYQFVIYARKEDALKITKDLKDCVVTSWNPEAVDVTSKKAGKAEGIRRMMEKYGIRQDEIMAFGDGENDIDMIEFAGIGVAMGNADERVKHCADYVTDDVDSDGIRKALEHFGML